MEYTKSARCCTLPSQPPEGIACRERCRERGRGQRIRCSDAPRSRRRGRLPQCRVNYRRQTDRQHDSSPRPSAGAGDADLDRHRRLRRLRARVLTFVMKDMRPLRVTAILSNLTFIAYGAMHALPPVLCLHFALLPLNLARLRQLQCAAGEAHAALAAGPLILAGAAIKVDRSTRWHRPLEAHRSDRGRACRAGGRRTGGAGTASLKEHRQPGRVTRSRGRLCRLHRVRDLMTTDCQRAGSSVRRRKSHRSRTRPRRYLASGGYLRGFRPLLTPSDEMQGPVGTPARSDFDRLKRAGTPPQPGTSEGFHSSLRQSHKGKMIALGYGAAPWRRWPIAIGLIPWIETLRASAASPAASILPQSFVHSIAKQRILAQMQEDDARKNTQITVS